jgi:hypothetical protein
VETGPYWFSIAIGGNRSVWRKPAVFGGVKLEALLSVALESLGCAQYNLLAMQFRVSINVI